MKEIKNSLIYTFPFGQLGSVDVSQVSKVFIYKVFIYQKVSNLKIFKTMFINESLLKKEH